MEDCPECGYGVLKPRRGTVGGFYGCSRFPACDFTRNLSRDDHVKALLKSNTSKRIQTKVKAGDRKARLSEWCSPCKKWAQR
ncbi:MAG: topoisomerase DNA-binding C4 zinc finger domain-containing protein [Hahellaceae bacterium]|nr:topoisomerase DNA-binding C4 zinc finger domain-containing protein [Hahellaceae bacterium]